jgi:molybdate transport system substrate-binding protein
MIPVPVTRLRASALLFGATLLSSVRLPGRAQTTAALKIIGVVPTKAALDEIVPAFEKASGHAAFIEYGGPDATSKLAAGEPFDVVITTVANLDTLIKAGIVLPDSRATFGITTVSLAYRSGSPKPDTSTLDALKAVLLKAKTISLSDPAAGAPASTYFTGVIQPLGISEDVLRKAILTKIGQGAFPVGDGRADIGVAQTSEIALVPGLEGVPVSPSDPKGRFAWATGVSSKSMDIEGARAFVKFMLAPAATAIRKAKGFAVEP